MGQASSHCASPQQERPILGLTPINPAPCSVGEYESGPDNYQPKDQRTAARGYWMTRAVPELLCL